MGRSNWVVITLSGHIDPARAHELTQVLAKEWHPTQNLLIDLSAVTSMGDTRWLFSWDSQVTKAGREMRLVVCEGGQVERLLSIVAVKNAFTIYRSLDKALDRISAMRFLRS